jgi:hypothetical protein
MGPCKSGKVGYPTAKQAKQTVSHIVKRSHGHRPMKWADAGALGAYHCGQCGQFHVGHQLKAKTRRPRLHLIDEDETDAT